MILTIQVWRVREELIQINLSPRTLLSAYHTLVLTKSFIRVSSVLGPYFEKISVFGGGWRGVFTFSKQ